MELFEFPPLWYTIIAVVVSLYQGYRGWEFQCLISRKVPTALGADTVTNRLLLRVVADSFTYLVFALAGFVALLIAYRILKCLASPGDITPSAVTLIVFLALFGLLGITGKLPDLVLQIPGFISGGK